MKTHEDKTLSQIHNQWRSLWRDTLNDKAHAEKIADKDYALLFIQQGTVVKTSLETTLSYRQIIQKHQKNGSVTLPVNPEIGGWGKFARSTINTGKKPETENSKPAPHRSINRQQKKNGRGWLHQSPTA